jgi:hypothetical protein
LPELAKYLLTSPCARVSLMSLLRFVRIWGALGADRRGWAYQTATGRDWLSGEDVSVGLVPKMPLRRVSIALALHTMETVSSTGRVPSRTPRTLDCACSHHGRGGNAGSMWIR